MKWCRTRRQGLYPEKDGAEEKYRGTGVFDLQSGMCGET